MAEWIIVALTFITLLVFFRYAYDTYRIAKTSVAQREDSLTPFLAVAMRENTIERQGGWAIQNQGFGPALNISYSRYDNNGIEGKRWMASLAKDAEYRSAHDDIANAFAHDWQFTITYESLSGKQYKTTARIIPGRGLETKFYKL